MLSWSSTLVMNRAEEVQLFRKCREVQVLRSNDDLVLSVLKAPVRTTTVGVATTSEDDDQADADDSEKARLQNVSTNTYISQLRL